MIRSLPLIVLMALLAGYIATLGLGRASEFPASGVRYAFFASPKESVTLLTNLAQMNDWQSVQNYVQRPNDRAKPATFTSGSFRFSQPTAYDQTPDSAQQTPPGANPGEAAAAPFPQRAEYLSSSRKTDDQIHVTIRFPLPVSSGNANAGRTATGTYHLIYTPFGYQILPD